MQTKIIDINKFSWRRLISILFKTFLDGENFLEEKMEIARRNVRLKHDRQIIGLR